MRDTRDDDCNEHHHRDQPVHVLEPLLGGEYSQEPEQDRREGHDQTERAGFVGEQPDGEGNLRRGQLRLLEGFHQRPGLGEAATRLLHHAAIDERGERRRQVGAHRRQWRQHLGELLDEDLVRARARHGRRPRDREPGHEAERVQVAAAVHVVAGRLLGAHVLGGAHHLAHPREPRAGGGGGDRSRDAEVHHEGAAGGALDHDVVGLDVAVHDAAAVGVGQRVRHVLQHAHGVARAERSGARDPVGEAFSLDVGHCEGEQVVAFLHRVHGHDVGVREARGQAGLAQEPFAERLLGGVFRGKHLEGDEAVEAEFARVIDRAHATAAEFALDQVAVAKAGTEGVEVGRGHRVGK